MEDEVRLAGGNTSGAVVRVGSTVRKSWLPTTPRIVEFLNALARGGVDVPRPHGQDDQGRLVLDFVPGTLAMDIAPLPDATVERVGRLIRRIHAASARLDVPADWPDGVLPAPRRELICHNDLAAWNLIVDGDRLVLIDWDGAAPSTRLWDLAYAAISFAHLFPGVDPAAAERRLRNLMAGYDADDELRAALPATLSARAQAMADLLRTAHESGREPWSTMYDEGHGELWACTAEFIRRHHDSWVRAMER